MSEAVDLLGKGAQRFAEAVLGWNRGTIRKGWQERVHDVYPPDQFSQRGRLRAEEKLPGLMEAICQIVEPNSQQDPTFRSGHLYTPLTAGEVRRRLAEQFPAESLPSERTLRNKLNELGYRLTRVRKCRPLKKIDETDAIFAEVHRINAQADNDPGIVRLSMDCKAKVKVGAFSRGGMNRRETKAKDHDFDPDAILTPVGILVPDSGESYLSFVHGPATADCLADRLEALWPTLPQAAHAHTLVLNADNGPESNGQRTQWLKRMVDFADHHQVAVQLAYYPPYHSKYNPVERLWGILEKHWNGELLDNVGKTIGLARSMTYRGIHPVVDEVQTLYDKGVTIAKKSMVDIEARLERLTGLEKWFITIRPAAPMG